MLIIKERIYQGLNKKNIFSTLSDLGQLWRVIFFRAEKGLLSKLSKKKKEKKEKICNFAVFLI